MIREFFRVNRYIAPLITLFLMVMGAVISFAQTAQAATVNTVADLPGKPAAVIGNYLYAVSPVSAAIDSGKNVKVTVEANAEYTSQFCEPTAPSYDNCIIREKYTVKEPIVLNHTSGNKYGVQGLKISNCTYNLYVSVDEASKRVTFEKPSAGGAGLECIDASKLTGFSFLGTTSGSSVSALTDEALDTVSTYTSTVDCTAITNSAAKAKCQAVKECHYSSAKPTADCIKSYNTCVTDPANADMVNSCAEQVKKGEMSAVYVDKSTPTPQCGGTLSWILCPLTTLISGAMGVLANQLDNFMRFDPLLGSKQGDEVFKIWQQVVGIANLLLVVAFMIVIFSQATSIGLSAYGIKKMLPRIIAAAILLNLSFYLCAIAIDITNIVGASIQGIMTSASNLVTPPAGNNNYAATDAFGTSVIVTVTSLVALTIAGATGALALIVPVLLSAFVSFLVMFLILAIRHVLTILLVIIAPLAFAAMILPNTDGLFKKWWKAFYISLALYPVIMALAYGSLLVSRIILATKPTDASGSVIQEGWFWDIFALIVMFAWIFAIKLILTWGAGLAGRIAGMVNDRNKGLIDRSKNWANEKKDQSPYQVMRKMRKQAQSTAAQRNAIQRYSQDGLMTQIGGKGLLSAATRGKVTWPYGKQADALLGTQATRAIAGINKEERETLAEYTNRPTLDLMGRGFQLNKDNNSFTHTATGKTFSFDQISDDSYMAAAGIAGVKRGVVARDALDSATISNMAYMRDSNVLGSLNGVKMVAERAFNKGAMDASMLDGLTAQVNRGDRGEFVEYANDIAMKEGHVQAGFNSYDAASDKIIRGGRLGGMNNVAIKMLKNFGEVSKDAYADKDNVEWAEAVHSYITDPNRVGPEEFKSELAKMNAQQAEKFLGIMNAAQQRKNGTDWMDTGTFNGERNAAIKEYRKS